jgi:hypothetical protein
MIRTFFIFIIVMALLQGCATPSSREIFLADGTKGYNINCSGSGMNYSNCLEKAGEVCGSRGYFLLNQQGNIVPFSAAIREFSAGTTTGSIGFLTQSGSLVIRNLFIKCKQE